MIIARKITHKVEDCFSELLKIAESDPDVLLVYLFGSRARGKVMPLSDVDLAVLLSEKSFMTNFAEKQRDLFSKFSRALKTDEVDLIFLNEAPTTLRYAVIKEGRLLFFVATNQGKRSSWSRRSITISTPLRFGTRSIFISPSVLEKEASRPHDKRRDTPDSKGIGRGHSQT